MESFIISPDMSRFISQSRFASYSSRPIVPGVEYESILQEASLDSGAVVTLPDWRCHPSNERHIGLVPTLHIQPRGKRVSLAATSAPAAEFSPETQIIEDQNYVFGDETRFGMTLDISRATYLSPEGKGDNGLHYKEPKLSLFESSMSSTVEQYHIDNVRMDVHPELDPMNPVIVQSNKRRRGRPRSISQHSKAERRRAQIRDAQRTYRERKEKTIADLKAQISKLQSAIDSMKVAFFELYNDGRQVAIRHRDSNFIETLTNVAVKILEASKEVDIDMEIAHLSLLEGQYKGSHVDVGQSSNRNSSSPEVDPIKNGSEFLDLAIRLPSLSEYFKLQPLLQRRELFH
ncbi:hypothetical protein V1517DRAFT_331201 [Lipomyces orientalis]|uniref:Uncharacterized protein n=1 Tax=Lipomyces orientalis TaxID=1233043 RepID=A0ACC3TFA0_9ASCO